MKYLIVIVILLVVYLLWRSKRADAQSGDDAAASTTAAPALPLDMVRCQVCSLHLPRSEALPGAGGLLYCSVEHRLSEKI